MIALRRYKLLCNYQSSPVDGQSMFIATSTSETQHLLKTSKTVFAQISSKPPTNNCLEHLAVAIMPTTKKKLDISFTNWVLGGSLVSVGSEKSNEVVKKVRYNRKVYIMDEDGTTEVRSRLLSIPPHFTRRN